MRSARLVDHIWKTYVAYRELLFMTYGVYMSCHSVKTAESVRSVITKEEYDGGNRPNWYTLALRLTKEQNKILKRSKIERVEIE